MAFNKRTWLGRQGTGLNKFSIGGATPVTIVNQPDSVTQVGDALSAGNLNDLEDRIEDAFDDVDTELDTKANEQDVTNLNNAISQLDHRLENIEQSKGDYIVSAYKDGSITPSGKGKWCVVEGVEGVSRCENNLMPDAKQSGSMSFSASTPVYNQYMQTFSTDEVKVIAGHTYLVSAKITRTISQNNAIALVGFCSNGSNLRLSLDNGSANGVVSVLYSPSASGYLTELALNNYYGKQGYDAGDSIAYEDYILTDLSVYFGGSIPSDADTIAKIQTNYPHLLLPTEYGTRIVDASYVGVRAWARNLLSPAKLDALSSVTRSGDTWTATMPNWLNATKVAGWGGVSFKVGQQYYVSVRLACASDITNVRIQINYTDGTYSITPFVQGGTTAVSGGLSTAGKTVANILFNYSSGTGNMTVSEFIINQSDSQDGTYTPWHAPSTLSFPSTSLKSAGSVREVYNLESGEVTHPLKDRLIADSELNYTKAGGIFYALLSDAKPVADSNVKANILCEKFIPTSRNGMTTKGQFSISSSGSTVYINFYWDDVSIADFLTAMADIYFRYELNVADPSTPATAILDNTLLTESGGRLSTVQTGTVVDGIADLGFITL